VKFSGKVLKFAFLNIKMLKGLIKEKGNANLTITP